MEIIEGSHGRSMMSVELETSGRPGHPISRMVSHISNPAMVTCWYLGTISERDHIPGTNISLWPSSCWSKFGFYFVADCVRSTSPPTSQDPRVNRLEDCLLLWITLISNKLLADVNIVLFLNKCDLLQVRSLMSNFPFVFHLIIAKTQAKLNAGVRLKDHMISYGDRLNDYDSVSKCRQYLHLMLLLQSPYLTLFR